MHTPSCVVQELRKMVQVWGLGAAGGLHGQMGYGCELLAARSISWSNCLALDAFAYMLSNTVSCSFEEKKLGCSVFFVAIEGEKVFGIIGCLYLLTIKKENWNMP